MKPTILAQQGNTARLGFPCGDPLCEDPDCVHVVVYRDAGIPDLELAPVWRAAAVLGPHGNDLRAPAAEDLMTQAVMAIEDEERRRFRRELHVRFVAHEPDALL